MTIHVAFTHDEPDASPVVLACEAFDIEQAGRRHHEDPDFSLNVVNAYFRGNTVVVPVEGVDSVDEVMDVALVDIHQLDME